MPPTAEAPAAPPPPAPTTDKPTAIDAPPSGERQQSDWMGGTENDFADMDAGKPLPPRERDDKGKFKPAAEKPAPKPAEKPPEKSPDEGEPPPAAEPPKPVKAAELRTAYEGLKKKVKDELEPEVQRLRAKVQEYENKPTEDTAPILQKIKAIESENKRLKEVAAVSDWKENPDYQKADQDYTQAWNRATNAFNQLTVRESDGVDEMGEPKFNRRPASEADLIKLGALPLSELDEAAQTMFGASASRAIQYIERLRDLAHTRQQAELEAKSKVDEWKSQRTLEQQNRAQTLSKTWGEINHALQEKFPKAFQVEDGNAEDKAAHTKGFALADLMFGGPASLTPEQIEALPGTFKDAAQAKRDLSDIERMRLHAIARLKIANHDRKVAALKKANERIKELETTLAQYESSEPAAGKAGEGGRKSDKPWDEQVADELKALDK